MTGPAGCASQLLGLLFAFVSLGMFTGEHRGGAVFLLLFGLGLFWLGGRAARSRSRERRAAARAAVEAEAREQVRREAASQRVTGHL